MGKRGTFSSSLIFLIAKEIVSGSIDMGGRGVFSVRLTFVSDASFAYRLDLTSFRKEKSGARFLDSAKGAEQKDGRQ